MILFICHDLQFPIFDFFCLFLLSKFTFFLVLFSSKRSYFIVYIFDSTEQSEVFFSFCFLFYFPLQCNFSQQINLVVALLNVLFATELDGVACVGAFSILREKLYNSAKYFACSFSLFKSNKLRLKT